MRREERVTVQGPVKKQQPDGMPHRGWGGPKRLVRNQFSTPQCSKNGSFRNRCFYIVTTHIGHTSHAKHAFASLMCVFPHLGIGVGIGLSNRMEHKLLKQFSTLNSSTMETSEIG